jgi:hypothetical protein
LNLPVSLLLKINKPLSMKKYFLKNETGPQGPFSIDELKSRGITADTDVCEEGTDNWTTAAKVEELKELLKPTTAAEIAATKAHEVIQTGVAPAAETAALPSSSLTVEMPGTAAPPAVKAARKKGSPVITWALSLAVLGGTGYYVYQDMEKNKTPSENIVAADTTGTVTDITATVNNATNDTTGSSMPDKPANDTTTAIITPPADVTDVAPPAKDPADAKKAADEKKKQLAAQQAKKKEEEKKKLAAEARKKEEEKKKQQAEQAAREMEMRNKWPRNVTIGTYKIEGDDKVKPFSIPVNNSYPVVLDQVTLRVDYLKKEKIVGSETLVLSNIPARGTMNVQAAGNKKGKTVNVYITGITSRQLQFCYPSGSGRAGDPYFCN